MFVINWALNILCVSIMLGGLVAVLLLNPAKCGLYLAVLALPAFVLGLKIWHDATYDGRMTERG